MVNSYFGIAENDYLYLQETRGSKFYNNVAVQCQQICEKLLKGMIELLIPDAKDELRTHNLKRLYDKVKGYITLEREHELYLGSFSDFYFDARYPGDDYTIVSEEDITLCLQITDAMYSKVSEWRKSYKEDKPSTESLIDMALKISGN